jgi:hypothetical protein
MSVKLETFNRDLPLRKYERTELPVEGLTSSVHISDCLPQSPGTQLSVKTWWIFRETSLFFSIIEVIDHPFPKSPLVCLGGWVRYKTRIEEDILDEKTLKMRWWTSRRKRQSIQRH